MIKRYTGTLIEQMKTKSQETLEYKLNKQMDTLAFSHPINFSEERRWLLAVTSFETANPNLNITDENNSFSISTPGQRSPEGSG